MGAGLVASAWGLSWSNAWGNSWGVLLDVPYESLSFDNQVAVRSVLSVCYTQSQLEQVLYTAVESRCSVRSAASVLGIATTLDAAIAGSLPHEFLASPDKDEQTTNVVLDTARVYSTTRRMSVGATNDCVSVSTSRTDLRSTT